YFGAVLLDELRRRGVGCTVYDWNPHATVPAGVGLVRGDVRSLDDVRAARAGVDVVFHCAAQVPIAQDWALCRSVNIEGTETVLRAAAAAGVRKVVHLSSSAIFGAPKENPVTPRTPPSPLEAYGEAKRRAEKVCFDFVARGSDVTIVR